MSKIIDPNDTAAYDEIRRLASPSEEVVWQNKLRIPHRWRQRWFNFFNRIAWCGFNIGIKVKK